MPGLCGAVDPLELELLGVTDGSLRGELFVFAVFVFAVAAGSEIDDDGALTVPDSLVPDPPIPPVSL